MGVACLRKKKFASEAAAQSVIYRMRAQGSDTKGLAIQKCPLCGGWHIRAIAMQVHSRPLASE